MPKLQEAMCTSQFAGCNTDLCGACYFNLDLQKLPCPKAEHNDAVIRCGICRVQGGGLFTCPPFAEKELFAEKSGEFTQNVLETISSQSYPESIYILKTFWIVKFGILILPP